MRMWLCIALCTVGIFLGGCGEKKQNGATTVLRFVTCPDYPPFEYYEDNNMVGFDMDVAKAIGEVLHIPVVVSASSFEGLFMSLENGGADAAISGLGINKERAALWDVSDTYFNGNGGAAIVYHKNQPINTIEQLSGKKVACQIASSFTNILKNQVPNAHVVIIDKYTESMEQLKSKHVDAVIVGLWQAQAFCKHNTMLDFFPLPHTNEPIFIFFPQQSVWKEKINNALASLEKSGVLPRLRQKWSLEK